MLENHSWQQTTLSSPLNHLYHLIKLLNTYPQPQVPRNKRTLSPRFDPFPSLPTPIIRNGVLGVHSHSPPTLQLLSRPLHLSLHRPLPPPHHLSRQPTPSAAIPPINYSSFPLIIPFNIPPSQHPQLPPSPRTLLKEISMKLNRK